MKICARNKGIIAGALLGLFLSGVALAQVPFGPPPDTQPGAKQRRARIARELNLSPQQQQEFEDLRVEQEAKAKKLIAQLSRKHKELGAELDKINTDQKKVDALMQEIFLIQKSLLNNRVKYVLEMKQVLAPAQYDQLLTILERDKKRDEEFKKKLQEKGQNFPSMRPGMPPRPMRPGMVPNDLSENVPAVEAEQEKGGMEQ